MTQICVKAMYIIAVGEFLNFILIESIFFRSQSRYPFQSFAPNSGTKGFPLLSGLGQSFS
jgi:hypothetical protein